MSATVVTGQANFTSNSANQGGSASANTVSSPSGVLVTSNKLIVADGGNNRVLIYNSIPTSSNISADIVIGQPDMTTTSSGCSSTKLNLGEGNIFSVNNKLFIVDTNNNRVLIYNAIPTTNGVAADVVIGQSGFTTCTSNAGGIGSKTLSAPDSVTSDGTKLIISDSSNNRVLIYNAIPTTNNVAADLVIGQANFTSSTANAGGLGNSTLSNPKGVAVYTNTLVVADTNNNRALIFTNIPTVNNDIGDNVIGQANFVSNSALQGGATVTANTIQPFHISIDTTGRLFVADKTYNRVLQYGRVPVSDNVAADVVIGQTTFTTSIANSGGVSGSSLSSPRAAFSTPTQLFIADGNHRILIYTGTSLSPSVTLDNHPQGQIDNSITMTGTATVDPTYTIKTAQFSINGGGFYDATPSNGTSFNSSSANFSFNFFDDVNNNKANGFTVKVRAINSNADASNIAFYFQPFEINKPDNNDYTDNPYPTFDFSVNTQESVLKESLSRYQIWVTKAGTKNWQLYLDNIAVDFAKIRNASDNVQGSKYSSQDTSGIYETSNLYEVFSENSSHILVYAKDSLNKPFDQGGKQLAGAYRWQVVAVDNAGHTQATDSQLLRVGTHQSLDTTTFFPLSLLSLTGMGDVNLSTIDPNSVKDSYQTSSKNPTFYGIAVINATVLLTLTEQDCKEKNPSDCISTYNTLTNQQSRFGINLPTGSLQPGKKYTVNLSAELVPNYIELPQFTLAVLPLQEKKSPQASSETSFLDNTSSFSPLLATIYTVQNHKYLIYPTSTPVCRGSNDNNILDRILIKI